MKTIYLPFVLVIFVMSSCLKVDEIEEAEVIGPVSCSTPIVNSGKYYEKDGKWYLYGGVDSSTHFEVSNFTLDPCKLNFGLGREHFIALREPEFEDISEREDDFSDYDRIVVLRIGDKVRLYPLETLRVHELINDRFEGQSIMVVYCFLADLAAVYERSYCSRNFTFGVSGYTYADRDIQNGLESFVLWDRETESLWWPINDRGVSGQFANGHLNRYDESSWDEGPWSVIKGLYPNAEVLKRNQFEEPPESWTPWGGC